jgi:hypothetical protein
MDNKEKTKEDEQEKMEKEKETETENKKTKPQLTYGFYSSKSVADGNKTYIYTTESGATVCCSYISHDANKSGCAYDDEISLGPVLRYVKSISKFK